MKRMKPVTAWAVVYDGEVDACGWERLLIFYDRKQARKFGIRGAEFVRVRITEIAPKRKAKR